MKYHILDSLLLLLLLLQGDSLEIKIQARSSCQLIVSTYDVKWRAWDEGELQKFGFDSIPGVIETSYGIMSKIYLKHLKPEEKVNLPRTYRNAMLSIFVK